MILLKPLLWLGCLIIYPNPSCQKTMVIFLSAHAYRMTNMLQNKTNMMFIQHGASVLMLRICFKCGSRDVYVCHCDDSTVSYTFVAFHQKWTIDYHAIVDALASGVSIPFQILLDVLVS